MGIESAEAPERLLEERLLVRRLVAVREVLCDALMPHHGGRKKREWMMPPTACRAGPGEGWQGEHSGL
eukprot:1905985-Prymnesium_polylepis.1